MAEENELDEESLVEGLPDDSDEDNANNNTPTGLAKTLQPIANALTLPDRLGRGLAVGTQKFLEKAPVNEFIPGMSTGRNPVEATQTIMEGMQDPVDTIGGAVKRGVEGFQPGFQPDENEKVTAMLGEIGGATPMAMAFGGVPAGAVAKMGVGRVVATILKENPKLVFQALRNAGAGAIITTIQQASERGDVELEDVGVVAGVSGLLPVIVPGARLLSKAVRSLRRNLLSANTTLTTEAAEEFVDNPKILAEVKGTAREIQNNVRAVQSSIKEKMDEAGTLLSEAREKFSIDQNLDEAMERVRNEGLPKGRSEQDILNDAADYVSGYRTSGPERRVVTGGGKEFEEKLGSMGINPKDAAEEGVKGSKSKMGPPAKSRGFLFSPEEAKIPFGERVKGLYRVRRELDSFIDWRGKQMELPKLTEDEARPLRGWRNRINKVLDGWAEENPGVKKLRDTDAIFSEMRQVYDYVQSSLSEESKAEEFLSRIAKGSNIDEILGKTGGVVERIRMIEKETGKKLLEPLRKSYLAQKIRLMKGTGKTLGPLYEAAGPKGLSRYGSTVDAIAESQAVSVVQKLFQELTGTPLGRAAVTAAASR